MLATPGGGGRIPTPLAPLALPVLDDDSLPSFFFKHKVVLDIFPREQKLLNEPTYSDFHVNLDSFALFESQIQLLSWCLLFLLYLLLILHPLEVILKCHIEIKGIRSITKAQPDECRSSCCSKDNRNLLKLDQEPSKNTQYLPLSS